MTSTITALELRPFTIDVPQSDLDDLAGRLARVRWPNVVDADDTAGGVPVTAVRRLVAHWRDGYDWRAAEAAMNRLDHVTTEMDGMRVHLVHQRAARPSGLPVLLLHGFPDTFHRFHKIVERLVDAGHDVAVPSLPGHGFSGQPDGTLTTALAGDVAHRLMAGLGYDRYAVHGGDWGSTLAEHLAQTYPESVAALHLTDVPIHHHYAVDRSVVSDAERAYLDAGDAWGTTTSYFTVQSADPTTLAFGLADSPVGLAAWMLQLYRLCAGQEPDLDDVLTQVSLYWHTNTIRSSFRLYAEGLGSWDDSGDRGADPGGDTWGGDGADTAAGGWDVTGADADGWDAGGRVEVPTAVALFPDDIGTPPREYAERFFAVERFTLMPRGGHFAALEEPELLVEDLISFLAGRS